MKKQQKNKSKKNNRRNGGSQSEFAGNLQTTYGLPRSLKVMPDRLLTRLDFFKSQSPAFVANITSFRFQPTAAFDIDPLLGGTFPPGFAELSTLYASYRVVYSSIRVDTVAGSNVPFRVIVVPLNIDPGAAASASTIVAWTSNPYAKSKLVPSAGGPTVVVSNEMTTEKIYGSAMVRFDDNFSSPVTTIPANNWYWAIGCYTVYATIANPPMIDCKISIEIEFYDRKVNL